MKKLTLLFTVTFWGVTASFGIDFSFSAGVGGLVGGTFTGYTLEDSTADGGSVRSVQTMERFDFGGFAFFDATYGEATVMMQGGTNTYGETMSYKSGGGDWVTISDGKGTGTEMSFGISLLAKYPIRLTERASLFPLLGMTYHIALLEWRAPEGDVVYDRTKGQLPADQDKNGDPFPLSAWNSFWITLGAGVDYVIAGPWFLRGEVLFGFRLPTGYENGVLEMTKQQFNLSNPKLSGLTGNPVLKIALGRYFFKDSSL